MIKITGFGGLPLVPKVSEPATVQDEGDIADESKRNPAHNAQLAERAKTPSGFNQQTIPWDDMTTAERLAAQPSKFDHLRNG